MERHGHELAGGLALTVVVVVSALFVAFDLDQVLLVIPVCAVSALAGRRMRSVRVAIVAFAVGLALGLLLVAARDPVNALSEALTVVLLVFALAVLPWWVGSYRRLRLEQRAREQQIIAAQARIRERARIAQDMHDSLGHELALIALSSGALELSPELDERQRAVASELRARAVAASDHLHDIVAVLRSDEAPGAQHLGHQGWSGLVERARESGLQVRLERTEPAPGLPPLSPAAVRAGHRVIQEALTNAVKHAPGSAAEVRVDESGDPVVIEVRNTRPSSGPGAPAGGGQGLTGLEERLRLIGGTLEAGPAGGGFAVIARFPRQARTTTTPHTTDPAEPPSTPDEEASRPRRRLRRITVLPALLAAVLGGVLFAVHARTVVQTALSAEDYGQLHPGQSRAEVAPLLPEHSQSEPPPILEVPPTPAGGRCTYHPARDSVLDLSQDMYRLCFRADHLVSKDHLLPKDS